MWYLKRLIIALPGYQISLTSCTKWKNIEELKKSILSKLFHKKKSFFQIQLHTDFINVIFSFQVKNLLSSRISYRKLNTTELYSR